MRTEVITPDEYMGDVISDLNKRRGQINGMDSRQNARIIHSMVPLSELFGYVTVLRSLTSGRASASIEISHYDVVPQQIAQEVLDILHGKIVFV
jgi:elongation factor G